MTTTPTHTAASDALTQALIVAGTRGERTPCSDLAVRDHWTSESEPLRRQAARWCIQWNCPVLTECGEAAIANDERAYVWGGPRYDPH